MEISAPRPAQPPVELRGIVKEGGAVYLTFFDPGLKKWTTLAPGEVGEDFAVESFNAMDETVVLRLKGATATIAMLGRAWRPSGAIAAPPAIAVASSVRASVENGGGALTPSEPHRSLALSPPEARRLELVASEIRQQLERAKFLASKTALPAKS